MSISRRSLIASAAALAASGDLMAVPGAAQKSATRKLPKGFLWGSATAGHQVEGNNVNADTWLFEQIKPNLFVEPSGDACDSYHRYEEDIAIVSRLGLNCYRFSVEWSRVEPAQGQFSEAALDHYSRMVDTCLRYGLAPIVTLSHFTVPRWFGARGGFDVPDSVDLFVRYAEMVTARLGDRMALALTFNEPQVARQLEWIPSLKPLLDRAQLMLKEAARVSGSNRFGSSVFSMNDQCEEHMIAAHLKAYQAIKAGPGVFPVGVSLAIADEQEVGDGSRVEEKKRKVYEPWLLAAGQSDFVGVQTYTRNRVGAEGDLPAERGSELTMMGYEFYPQALGATIRYAASVAKVPVYVTENGCAVADDRRRIAYIDEAMRQLRACLADGIDVRGYIHWSLLDNFEWSFGYRPTFGLVAVDRHTFKRTPKPSAWHFGRIAKSNRIG
jgi:beta-glucosidase